MASAFAASASCTCRVQTVKASAVQRAVALPRTVAVARPFRGSRSTLKQQCRSISRQAATPIRNEVSVADRKAELKQCKKEIQDLIRSKHCNPIIVRLAWHDCGTYDKNVKEWPQRGGANGSIRFYPETQHGANAGLIDALNLLKDIVDRHEGVSHADLFQLASVTAIEMAGGPSIPLRLGRRDTATPEDCAPEGRLPAAAGPFPDAAPTPGQHLKNVFYRMGLGDKEIVALSGAHTLGRVNPARSGFGKESTKYTKDGPGVPGGSSWTPEWLVFDNSYFVVVEAEDDPELVVLPTDKAVFLDDDFRPFAELYAADQEAFFRDYVEAHLQLSELGAEWEVEPFTLDD